MIFLDKMGVQTTRKPLYELIKLVTKHFRYGILHYKQQNIRICSTDSPKSLVLMFDKIKIHTLELCPSN